MTEKISSRLLMSNDWQNFRAIRLKALQEHPDVYLGSYQAEAREPDSYWHETLDGNGKCILGLFDNNDLIGIGAVFTWRGDPMRQSGVMAMDYIEPRYRGRGFSRLLYQGRIEWALTQKQFTKLIISHREGNETSRRANQAFGFECQGKERIRWPDGTDADEWNYHLDLEKLRIRGSMTS
jgi:RimJ/RimL family protein N-acetyltransferase